MKKRVYGKKLSRGRGARKALFRGLIRALVEHGSIKTTKAKAKAVQGDIDRVVNMAKEGSVASSRRVYAALGNDKRTTDKLIKVIAKKMKGINSGYTRVVPLPQRRGDMADMARLEWSIDVAEKKEKKSKKGESGNEDKGVTEKLKSVAKRGKKSSKSKKKKSSSKSKKKRSKKSKKKSKSKSNKPSKSKKKTGKKSKSKKEK